MAVIRQDFRFHGTDIDIGWGATLVLDMNDFAVKTFAGTALLDICMNDQRYVYAGVGIVPEIEATYLRRGYVVCRKSTRMYARFFDARKALRYYNKSELFAIPMAVWNFLSPAPHKSSQGKSELVGRFDPRWDGIWEKLLSGNYEFYGKRTAEYLNYKTSQPYKTYQIFIHKDEAGNIDGYIVYRLSRHSTKDLNIVRICDLVGSASAKAELLAQAIDFARSSQADGIVGLSSSRDEAVFKSSGLWLSLAFPVGIKPEFSGKVHITFFDSDLDNLW